MTEPTRDDDPAIEDDVKPSEDAANHDNAAKPVVEEQRKSGEAR